MVFTIGVHRTRTGSGREMSLSRTCRQNTTGGMEGGRAYRICVPPCQLKPSESQIPLYETYRHEHETPNQAPQSPPYPQPPPKP